FSFPGRERQQDRDCVGVSRLALCASGRVGRCSYGTQRRLLHGRSTWPRERLGAVSFEGVCVGKSYQRKTPNTEHQTLNSRSMPGRRFELPTKGVRVPCCT